MKKTLIALMALAGAACADEIPNDLNIAPGGNFWGGDFTLTFTLNEGVLSASDTIDVLALYWGTYTDANYNSNGITLTWASDEEVTLYIGDGSMAGVGESASVAKITESTTFTGGRGATFTTKLEMGKTYTLVNVAGNANQSVSLYSGLDTSVTALETVTYNGNMNGGNADTTMGSLVNSQYAVSVPEPTTATLSLLALAGLAARRRRK